MKTKSRSSESSQSLQSESVWSVTLTVCKSLVSSQYTIHCCVVIRNFQINRQWRQNVLWCTHAPKQWNKLEKRRLALRFQILALFAWLDYWYDCLDDSHICNPKWSLKCPKNFQPLPWIFCSKQKRNKQKQQTNKTTPCAHNCNGGLRNRVAFGVVSLPAEGE